MNIADIDLDVFLDDVLSLGQSPRAPATISPWNEGKLRNFLENQCGLKKYPSTDRPEGRFIVHHDEAFPILEALSQNGAVPLTVTHIDAHSDLGTGFGDLSWIDIGKRLLGVEWRDRVNAVPRNGMEQISPANYLSFALACRWIASLTYVHHPSRGDDLMPFFFRDFDPASDTMELRFVPRADEAYMREDLRSLPHTLEPPIAFQLVSTDDYQAAKPFDYVILCQSPGYTPVEADLLIPIFGDYVDFDLSNSQSSIYLGPVDKVWHPYPGCG
ncbi:hypothetical protein [Devosia sp. LjRoot3]|uniref:hypothetical protein n=1 Tax=Devosia sp. LjRoot3 TaxID=3342319 RepID=UPI003ECD87C6